MERRTVRKPWIVAVDGPAGCGKSSVCRRVAQALGWFYLSTGILYRGLAVACRGEGVSRDNIAAVADLAHRFAKDVRWDGLKEVLVWQGRSLSHDLLYEESMGQDASLLAQNPEVRHALLPLQRRVALETPLPGAILDGRDIGTVVFPDANLKIFMTASLGERARRRFRQLHPGISTDDAGRDLSSIEEGMAQRDRQDQSRDHAPLRQAEDARLVDTSSMSEEDAAEWVMDAIKKIIG